MTPPRFMKTVLAAVVVLSFAAGCDSEVIPAGGGGSGPVAGNGGDGGSDGGNGNGGDGTGGGSDECEQYIDQEAPPVQTIPISIRNGGAIPIYLGVPRETCAGDPLYRAETPAGDPVKTDRTACEQTCSELTQFGCDCAAECAQPAVIMIHPGGQAELSWTAVIYESEAMPEVCYSEPSCAQPTCISPITPPSALTFFIDGYPDVADCSQAICDCDGGESGACFVEGASLVGGTPVTASAEWAQSDVAIGFTFE